MSREADSQRVYLGVTVLMALCQFVFALDFNTVNAALASIGRGLTLSPAQLSWVMSSYFLPYAGLLILGGKSGDVYGRRLPCVVGLCGFGIASVGAFLAPDFSTLLIVRCVEGMGCAFMIPTTFSLINVTLPPGKLRHRAFALYGASQGLAILIGLFLGGLVTTHFGWRAVFLLNLPPVALALMLALRFVPGREGRAARRGLDITGATLITAAITLLIFGIAESGRKGVVSGEALSGLIGALVLLCAFVWVESRVAEPLLPMEIFRHVNLTGADMAILAMSASVGGTLVLLNLYMQQVMQLTATMAGLRMLPFGIGVVVSGKLLDRMMGRFQLRPTAAMSALVTVIGAVGLSFAALSPNYAVNIAPAMVLFSVGSIAANTTLMALSTASVPVERQGVATGVLIACQQVGMAVGVSSCLAVLNAALTAQVSLTAAFARSFLTVAGAATLGVILVLALTRGSGGADSVAPKAGAVPY